MVLGNNILDGSLLIEWFAMASMIWLLKVMFLVIYDCDDSNVSMNVMIMTW